MLKKRFLLSLLGTCVVMVVLSGIVWQHSANAINTPFNNNLEVQDGIHLSGSLDIYASSQDIGTWTTVNSPTQNSLISIDMVSANDGWAVGALGTILRWNGDAWEVATSPTTRTLRAVSMVSATDGWAVGDAGTVLRWDGQQWTIFPSPDERKMLRYIEMVSSTDGWITGGGGSTQAVIFHWNGNDWIEVSKPTSNTLYDVAMVSSVDGWTTDRYGMILHWDGNEWSTFTNFPNQWLNTTDMVSSTDGWTAGEFGRIKRWDGNEWSTYSSPTGQWLLSIDMLSATEGWMVGSDGTILYWDGNSWSDFSSPTTNGLSSVSMVSNTDGWAVGGSGTILRYHATSRFLEFPIDYSDSDFATVVGLFEIEGGLVTTRVDHERSPSSYMAFDGVPRTSFSSDDCRTSKFNACYNQADAPDIAIDRRTPVLAAFDGKVVGLKSGCVEDIKGCGDGFGNYVWLDHANCYRTRYSHLQSISVSYGDKVDTGEPVGLSGNTGKSEGPHLDFQVRFDPNCTDGTWTGGAGVIVDPYGWNPFDPNRNDPLSTNTGYLWKHPISSKSSIDSSGGSASNTNNNFNLIVPNGGLSGMSTVEVGSGQYPDYPDSGWFSIVAGYWFRILEWFNPLQSSLGANQFNVPAEVQIVYEESSLAHMDESTATIHQWDNASSEWLPLNTTLDTNNNLATAETLTHGIFTLQAQLLCDDVSEPNDEWGSSYVLEDSFTGSFDSPDDEDWYVVELVAGRSISASILDLGADVKSTLELYVNGDVYIDSDDSVLVLSAPPDQGKVFYLRMVPDPLSSVGCGSSYTLELAPREDEAHQTYLPIIIR